METNIQGLVQSDEAQFLVAEATEGNTAEIKDVPESEELGTSVASATIAPTNKYSTEPPACQIAAVPTLEEIENEIATAARSRIETALRDLGETRARIDRERTARETALNAAEECARVTQSEVNGIETDRAAMEHRAQTFLTGEALKLAMGNIHLGFNAKQLELEDALATAQADAHALQEEIHAADVTDALEIQMAERYLGELETAAREVAKTVRLAISSEENLAAAEQAVAEGHLTDAEVLLGKAKAGNADLSKIVQIEQLLAEATREKKAHDLIARINAIADQPRAVRRIRKLIAEAEAIGVAGRLEPAAQRALRISRDAANARFAQARPIADHLVAEGFVPVVGDGRIEAWKEIVKNGHGTAWTLDRVLILRGETWETKRPRVAVTRRELPKQVERSRWFNRNEAVGPAQPK